MSIRDTARGVLQDRVGRSRGSTAIEYALLFSLIAGAFLLVDSQFGQSVQNVVIAIPGF